MAGAVFVCLDEPAPADPSSCSVWEAQGYEPSPFALDADAAIALAVPILTLWALAFVFRTLARLIREL